MTRRDAQGHFHSGAVCRNCQRGRRDACLGMAAMTEERCLHDGCPYPDHRCS